MLEITFSGTGKKCGGLVSDKQVQWLCSRTMRMATIEKACLVSGKSKALLSVWSQFNKQHITYNNQIV